MCIFTSTLASVIVLVPSAGDIWSHWTYPTVAHVDRQLAHYGLGLWPRAADNATSDVAVPHVDCPVLLSLIVEEDDEPVSEPRPRLMKTSRETAQGPIVRPVGMTTRIPIAPSDADDLLQ